MRVWSVGLDVTIHTGANEGAERLSNARSMYVLSDAGRRGKVKLMRRKDRTSEEKQADRIFRGGLLKLGALSPAESTPKPFPHYLFWDVKGRKGQRCRVVNPDYTASSRIQVEFEDGASIVVDRRAIRRI